MAPITIPEGFSFVPRRAGVNVAAQLFKAVDKVKADRHLSVRTVSGGYHVENAVAEAYAAAQPEAAEEIQESDTIETTDPTGDPVVIEGQPIPDGVETPATTEEVDAAADAGAETGNSDGENADTDGENADSESEDEDESEETLEPLPVTAESSHSEIDDYAGTLDPKVEFPAGINRADKIKLLEEARTPQAKE